MADPESKERPTSSKFKLAYRPSSESLGRVSGTLFATSVAEALVRTEIIGESEQDPKSAPTFATFTKVIHDILVEEVDFHETPDTPSFAAQDDLWGNDARWISGFPISSFEERYYSLPLAHQGSRKRDLSSDQPRTASGSGPLQAMGSMYEALEGTDWSTICALLRLPIGPAQSRITELAMLYVQCTSNNEARVSGVRAEYGICRRFLEGENIPWYDLELMVNALHYRMYSIIGQANDFKRFIGTSLNDFPWCNEIDVYEKQNQIPAEKKGRYSTILELIDEKGAALFDPPSENAGLPFTRGTRYLALALLHTNWSGAMIEQTLVDLAQFKAFTSKVKSAVNNLNLRRRDTVKRHLKDIARSCKRRLRDSSPVKLFKSESQQSISPVSDSLGI